MRTEEAILSDIKMECRSKGFFYVIMSMLTDNWTAQLGYGPSLYGTYRDELNKMELATATRFFAESPSYSKVDDGVVEDRKIRIYALFKELHLTLYPGFR